MSGPAAQVAGALAAALVHFVWQGAAIAALAGAGLLLAGPRAPRARHAVLLAALAAMALAFGGTLALGLAGPAAGLALPEGLLEARPATGAFPAAGGGDWSPLPSPLAASPRATAWLLAAWAAGTALMALRLAGGALRVAVLVRRDARPLPPEWAARAAALARALGLRTAARVRASARVAVPLLGGFVRPVVVLPAAALTGLSPAALEALLAHELAHLARRDHLVNLLQALLETLLFFHPAVWWVSRRLRAEREYCCDDLVVRRVAEPVDYAQALLDMETLRSAPRTVAAAALAADGGPLVTRIRRILAHHGPDAGRPAPRAAGAPFAAAGMALFAAAALLLGAALPAGAIALADLQGTPAAPLGADAGLGIPWLPEALRPWLPQVREAAAAHGVDPRLVALVLLVESAGDPAARSPLGARGLMQILPQTGAFIARERGIAATGFDPARLDDPRTNIDFGTWLLARGLADFGAGRDPSEAVELAAAAYNGGSRAVGAWLAGEGQLSDETSAYKDLVRALWRDRAAPRSPAFEAWLERGGRRLLRRP